MKWCLPILLLFNVFVFSSCTDKKLFTRISSSSSGIGFNNTIVENDSINPLKEVNVYNGGGVGVGDFNNDGLSDLYFTANMVENRLYLNKGDFKFEDVTKQSGTGGGGAWSRGVSVIDINQDGWDDLYVSVAITKDSEKRKNLLYINSGKTGNGVPVFHESARAYGLDDTTHTAMSYFFDYDNDGDLDVYLAVNHHVSTENQNKFRPIKGDGTHPSTGRLYRNDWNATLKHPVFSNVSQEAGITIEGYGHAAVIADINRDGWKDIYVTNDFISSNILYINNRNGTFTDSSRAYFKQTSTFSMGADMQDINNDGLMDIVELDMNPEDNYRDKMIIGSNSYQYIDNFKRYGYQLQYMRNTLQLNQGRAVRANDSIGNFVFSQIGYFSGIAETDWSWAPIVCDFDNDGWRDVIVTNGYPKDITNHDFIVYRSEAALVAPPSHLLKQVPEVKLRNYAYRNNGNLKFENTTFDWGFDEKTFANGGVYADLDNDGDMDVVINNINGEASVYRNNINDQQKKNYINFSFQGPSMNLKGYGAWIEIHHDGMKQVYEHSPYRGYVSTHQSIAHFGLDSATSVDSALIVWPDGRMQVLNGLASNKTYTLRHADATREYSYPFAAPAVRSLFTDVTGNLKLNYTHEEKDFPDFAIQKLLPHKFTEYSPALAVGDLDGNGIDDLVIGGNSASPATILFQQKNGTFIRSALYQPSTENEKNSNEEYAYFKIGNNFKDAGIVVFDADNDNDLDVYVAGGGYAYRPNSTAYNDRLYVNDGRGKFTLNTDIPQHNYAKSCVRAVDYDKDGDLDLFVGGRVQPMKYPAPVSSILLRNDSKDGRVLFTDVTATAAGPLVNIGMVCDAVFTDVNNDSWPDLVLTGEWIQVKVFVNERGTFRGLPESGAITNLQGWWNSIAPGDFDNDGDIDFIVSNLGQNSYYRASKEYPVNITAGDFDNNGSYDAFPSVFIPASHDDSVRREFPTHTRDEIIKQMVSLKRRFTNYHSFATAPLDKILNDEERGKALRLQANCLSHVYVRNDGNFKFSATELPAQSQLSVINGMVVEDFDSDGNLDVLMSGNDYGTDVNTGRYDALNGLLLKGDGSGGFKPLSIAESGIYIPGNGKALVLLQSAERRMLIAASENNGPLKIFSLKGDHQMITFEKNDVSATVEYKNGKTQKRELYSGYSFLSHSAKAMNLGKAIKSVRIADKNGTERTIFNR